MSTRIHLTRDARWEIGKTMLGGQYDHSWNCSAHDADGACDCWAKALQDLLDLAANCSCGSAALYREDPPRLGSHHYASCPRWRRYAAPTIPAPAARACPDAPADVPGEVSE